MCLYIVNFDSIKIEDSSSSKKGRELQKSIWIAVFQVHPKQICIYLALECIKSFWTHTFTHSHKFLFLTQNIKHFHLNNGFHFNATENCILSNNLAPSRRHKFKSLPQFISNAFVYREFRLFKTSAWFLNLITSLVWCHIILYCAKMFLFQLFMIEV